MRTYKKFDAVDYCIYNFALSKLVRLRAKIRAELEPTPAEQNYLNSGVNSKKERLFRVQRAIRKATLRINKLDSFLDAVPLTTELDADIVEYYDSKFANERIFRAKHDDEENLYLFAEAYIREEVRDLDNFYRDVYDKGGVSEEWSQHYHARVLLKAIIRSRLARLEKYAHLYQIAPPRTYYSVKFSVGVDEAYEAYFNCRSEAFRFFANAKFAEKPVAHVARVRKTKRKLEQLCESTRELLNKGVL